MEPYANLSDIWDEIHYLGYLGDKAWRNYKFRKSVIENVTDLIQTYKEINIFLSDISWPLNNMIYGKFKKIYRKNIAFYNFPDGIGNLLFDSFSLKEKVKILIKSLFKYFGFFQYYYYSGDRMGMKYFDKVYSFMPNLLYKKNIKNVEQIELKIKKINTEKSLVFLGEPLENHFNNRSLVDLYEKTALYLSKIGFTELYYKKHHRESSDFGFEIFNKYGFRLLEDTRCIEEISYEKGFNYVASFVSSALPQLKFIFGDQIECVSINSDYVHKAIINNKRSLDQLNTIYNLLEVRKVNI